MAHSHHCVKGVLWLNAIMQDRKPQDQDKFIVRLPDGMRDRIKAAADANSRSMNSEIVATLEEKYPQPASSDLPEVARMFLADLAAMPKARRESVVAAFLQEVEGSERVRGVAD